MVSDAMYRRMCMSGLQEMVYEQARADRNARARSRRDWHKLDALRLVGPVYCKAVPTKGPFAHLIACGDARAVHEYAVRPEFVDRWRIEAVPIKQTEHYRRQHGRSKCRRAIDVG